MKRLLLLLVMIGYVGVAHAQSNVAIALGATYAGGAAQFSLLNPQGYTGALQPSPQFAVLLNASGAATLTTLGTGVQYASKVCKSDGSACLLATVNVSGQAQDITTSLQAYPIGTGAGSLSGSLTATRVPFASGASTLTDSANLTFSGGLLRVAGAGGGTFAGFPAPFQIHGDSNAGWNMAFTDASSTGMALNYVDGAGFHMASYVGGVSNGGLEWGLTIDGTANSAQLNATGAISLNSSGLKIIPGSDNDQVLGTATRRYNLIRLGTGASISAGTFQATQFTSTIATGTAPLVVTSITPVTNMIVAKHPTIQYCGTTTTCANTAQTGVLVVYGTVALSSGTPSTATITALPFTSSSTYVCTGTEATNAIGNLIKFANASGASTVITGPATVTDVIGYHCIGT